MYIKRALEKEIIDSSKEFACITIYGARQNGKSTTIKHIFGKNFNYVTLDDLSVRNYAITDLKRIYRVSQNKNFHFLEKYGKNILNGLIIESYGKIQPLNGNNIYYCSISLIGL